MGPDQKGCPVEVVWRGREGGREEREGGREEDIKPKS